jgi:hypothetical protein
MSKANRKKGSMLWHTAYGIEMGLSNAAPEWQAESLWWRSSRTLGACPLEGCVRSVASLQTTSADLRFNGRDLFIQGVTKGIVCLP